MILLALLLLTLVTGGSIYDIVEGITLDVETGSYRVEVERREKAYIWLPKGSYNVTLRLLTLGGGLTGVVVILANASLALHEVSMSGVGLGVGEGFNLRVSLSLTKIASCEISNITFWRGSYYGEELKQILRAAVGIESAGSGCKLTVDTGGALPGFLYVTVDRWATITISGSGYAVAVVYGVWRGQARGDTVTTPAKQDNFTGAILPETPIPLDVFRRELRSEIKVNYGILLGLILALILVTVVEYASAKRGY